MKVVIFPRFITFLPPVFQKQAIKVDFLPKKRGPVNDISQDSP